MCGKNRWQVRITEDRKQLLKQGCLCQVHRRTKPRRIEFPQWPVKVGGAGTALSRNLMILEVFLLNIIANLCNSEDSGNWPIYDAAAVEDINQMLCGEL